MSLSYQLVGDLTRLRIPETRPPRRADQLWRHSCFEAFVRQAGQPAYREYNFALSREWAAYGFRRYREGMQPLEAPDPAIVARSAGERLELDAVIQIKDFLALQLGLAAVVEELDGTISYWALLHPLGKPDFHHPDTLAVELR
ncbi:MAG: DOMON-like domain-containing protein [Nevskiales bacterium]